MLNIGMTELLVFGIIALLILGPDKLPEAARFMGKWYSKIKRTINNVHQDIDRELRLSELRAQMQQEMQRIQALEVKMQNQLNALEHHQRLDEPEVKVHQTYHFIAQSPNYVFRPYGRQLALSCRAINSTTAQQINHQHFSSHDLNNKNYQVAL
ncbi:MULTISPECIES: Sec-independent protein translocase protein TatB [unclassified Acinetobacter]|uniref:Sec-independent protein translocase protein TatB n=1 Tax=unclassified Acinetobacter TaxID=196816 RepID=UPI002934A12D|nr:MULTISPECIES: Sec-independent protein translocase protein TatB [unclassified Acinetobacter]WOE30525.1 Sec-independent protein translocase protein TatB [Acinetobacter sp. SAAs470]WOE38716.1 Sec-independent protein translocase protein TatB [Acinetobacter sp. SAAs474]